MKFNSTFIIPLLLPILLTVGSCGDEGSSNYRFEQLDSDHTGIHFRNRIPEDELTNSFVYEYVYNGGGVAVGDINNDGLDDIYFVSNLESNRLYLNEGNLQFRDVTRESATGGGRGWSTGTNMVDINNDGLLDIYVCKSGPYEKASLLKNELFINKGPDLKGDPIFVERAEQYGLADTSYSIQSAFFDYDRDGDLDMYLMNHNPQTFAIGDTKSHSSLGDKFYANENGKFVERTREVGIHSNSVSYGLGIGISDLNNDGWPDIYISNDYDEPDYMYINRADGTFREVIKEATNHIANFSMGNDLADFNNDGFIDVLTLDMVSEDNYGMKTSMASMNPQKFNRNVMAGKHHQYMYNVFHRHSGHIDTTGVPFFSDVAQMTGVSNTDWSWAPLLADFDNDGRKDIFITNGIKRDFRNKDFFAYMQDFRRRNPDALVNPDKIKKLIADTPHRPHKNYFYKNKGGLTFENVSDRWVDHPSVTYSNGAAYSDLDNDGDLDIVINNVDDKAQILRNNSNRSDGEYLRIKFEGPNSNRFGIGAKIELYTGKGMQVYENYTVRGYQSSVPPKIHLGLPKGDRVDSLLVYWPDSGFQRKTEVGLNDALVIDYKEAVPTNISDSVPQKMFLRSDVLADLVQVENDFDDYAHQVLLPHKMSRFGPAMAVGDVDSDGLEDLYFGQSTGTVSSLYLQNRDGSFRPKQNFVEDALYEDVDAEFFDFDNDGDLDLYVASGGNEFGPKSQNYADRLYENRKGTFVNRPDLLPDGLYESSSRIAIADYDNDGYLDLFVGGRHVPHQYPERADSHVLRNDKGRFVDVTGEVAPDLLRSGLVTDATFTDYDMDGDLDLLLVGEWMGPTILENGNGSFERRTSTRLDSLAGWYFSIAPLDIDKDGDQDYILGNLGENYKYKATATEPFEVYYGDFDDNGSKDLVLGYYNFGELFPVRGRECSAQQVPGIKKSIPTYDEFGKSSLTAIYGGEKLSSALHLKAHNFKSGILKNNGNGNLEFIALPPEAQISSINTIAVKDVNGDGLDDLILAGNLFASEVETPRNDAGYGMVLLQRAPFEFEPLSPAVSGFFVPGDVKTMKILEIGEETHVLAGNNSDSVSVFRIPDVARTTSDAQ